MSKYCKNCGMENENSAKFCHGCGTPLTEQEMNAAVAATVTSNMQNAAFQNMQNVTASMKKLPKHVLFGAVAVGVVLIAGGGMMISSHNTINLNRYLTVDVEGYDGYGQVTADIDWDAIEKKYGSKISFTKEAREEYGEFLKQMKPIDVLEQSVYLDIDNYSGLSNDDTVIYTWSIPDDVYDVLDCKIKAKNGEKKVSGLEKAEAFDAFANMELSFTGRDGNGTAEITNSGAGLDESAFHISKKDGLSNGDQVTVSISTDQVEKYAEKTGRIPQEQKKEYTVSGLSYYLKDASQISADSMTKMQQQAEDVYRANAAKDWEDGQSLESLSYLGNYLLTAKNSQDNYLFLVYKAQVHDSYTNEEGSSYNETHDVYWYIRYEDILADEAGNLDVDVTKYDTTNSYIIVDSGVHYGWWSTKTWRYYGFEDLEDLYKSVVTINLDSYNHQDNMEV